MMVMQFCLAGTTHFVKVVRVLSNVDLVTLVPTVGFVRKAMRLAHPSIASNAVGQR